MIDCGSNLVVMGRGLTILVENSHTQQELFVGRNLYVHTGEKEFQALLTFFFFKDSLMVNYILCFKAKKYLNVVVCSE